MSTAYPNLSIADLTRHIKRIEDTLDEVDRRVVGFQPHRIRRREEARTDLRNELWRLNQERRRRLKLANQRRSRIEFEDHDETPLPF